MANIRKALSQQIPGLGILWRKWSAWRAKQSPVRTSYAQHGEDRIVAELLKSAKPEDGIYVDVGANHPSTISNTYRLYREGFRGVIVEPNEELLRLHRWIRPGDVQVGVGCGAKSRLAKFHLSKTPVLSSFQDQQYHGGEDWKTMYLPILTLDAVMAAMPEDPILFLNIDVEGLDFEVLLGGENTLKRTKLLCIEANEKALEDRIKAHLEPKGWRLAQVQDCNLFFLNDALA